jgi:hypothetical protein
MINLDDVQIVNGLQTTQCLYDYIKSKKYDGDGLSDWDEKRSLLVKIIVMGDSSAKDKIIKATNFQTSIPPASLKATDKIQRDIEDYFKKFDWYYDRRKNYYKNIGKPLNKIISIPYMAQCMMAINLQQPDNARARPSSLIKKSEEYSKVFDSSIRPELFLFCAQAARQIENISRNKLLQYSIQEKSNLKFHICMVCMMKILKTIDYDTPDLMKIKIEELTEDIINSATQETVNLAKQYMSQKDWSLDRLAKSKEFVSYIKNNLTVK